MRFGTTRLGKRRLLTAYVFVLPIMAYFTAIYFYPIASAFWLSLHKANLMRPPQFVGLANYQKLINDPIALISLKNTFYYVILWVPLGLLLSLFFALVFNRTFKFYRVFRSIFFLPVITSMVSTSIVWKWLYQPNFGLLNYLLQLVGIPKQLFLNSPNQVIPSLVAVSIWKTVGFYMVIFLAGLQNIPKSLYEAASIDGASERQQLFGITLPLLKDTIVFNLLILVIQAFQVFTTVYIMTAEGGTSAGGGPGHASRVVVLYLVDKAFRYFEFGYGAALSFVLFGILLVFTLIQMRFYRYESSRY